MAVAEVGTRQYELVRDWGRLPSGWTWGITSAVATDSQDNVHVFVRTDHPIMTFDKSGTLLDSWGNGLFARPHGICVTPSDDYYFVDDKDHLITKFNKSGKHQLTLGERGKPSDTGWTEEAVEKKAGVGPKKDGLAWVNGTSRGGPPFNRPTNVAVDVNGEIFVTDGYRNSRIHKFAADGRLLKSWGEPGHARDLLSTKKGPGLFHTPHGIAVHKGKVYACDKENWRIQIFDTEGNFLDMWTNVVRPCEIYIDPQEEVAYTAETHQVSVLDLEGNVLWRHGGAASREPGQFFGPHGIWADSEGSIYVAEVADGNRLQKFARIK